MTPSLIGSAPDDRAAFLAADGEAMSYGELRERVAGLSASVEGLVFLRAELNMASLLVYIACFEARVPILLLDRDLEEELLERLVETYVPSLVIGFDTPPTSYEPMEFSGLHIRVWQSKTAPPPAHPDLAVLLSTSGSTGSPKLVRLSRYAVLSNADAIIEGLGIRTDDRAITCLPYSYTYGLSIINSHLRAGATIVVSDAAVTTADFWRVVDEFGVTALAGVPTTYKMLRQMRWSVDAHTTVRYATQAGGRLGDLDREHFRDMFHAAGAVFYVMYGQTEATARITITAPEDLFSTISTAGRVVAGGQIDIRRADAEGVGEVWYSGPNVMLGYAERADDLARGDDMGGQLATGDLGYVSDGKLFLTGRSKRIVKVFGKRVSLDDVDQWMHGRADAVSVQGNDAVVVFVVGETPESLRAELAAYLHVHPTGVRVQSIDSFPLLSSGKIDFQSLNARAQS